MTEPALTEEEAREEAVARARERQALAAIQRDEDLRAILALPAGRRWLWRFLEEDCLLHSDTYEADDKLEARNAGRRRVGIDLLREAQRVSQGAYLAMVVEEALEAQKRAAEDEAQALAK